MRLFLSKPGNRNTLGYFYYLLGEGVTKVIIFLVFSFFANYFSKTDFGNLSLFWISIPLVSILFDLSQRSYIKSVYIFEPEETYTVILNSYMFSGLILVLLCLIHLISIFTGRYVINAHFDIYIILGSFLFTLIELPLSYFQIKGETLRYNLFFLLRNSLPYLGTFLVIYLITTPEYHNPVLFAQVQLITSILVIIGVNVILFRNKNVSLDFSKFFKSIRKALHFSLPILPGILSALLLSFSDRFVINYFYSEVEVANYTVAYTVCSIFMAFFLATNKMWQKFILEELKNENIQKIRKAAKVYLFIVLTIGISIVLIRTILVELLSNATYFVILDIIPVLIVGMFFYFLFTVLSNVPFYYKDTFLMTLPAIIAMIVNLLLNIILIPKFGYKVAAFTTAFGYFIQFAITYGICIKKYKLDLFFYGITEKYFR